MNCGSTQHRGLLTTYRAVGSPESALKSVKHTSNEEGMLYRPDLANEATKTSIQDFAIMNTEVKERKSIM